MKRESNELLGRVSSRWSRRRTRGRLSRPLWLCESISFIPANSVDYVFTDPPGDQYLIQRPLVRWMGFSLPFEQEIFPHETEFEEDMARALRELACVLRPTGR